ncbi:hypothetical protein [Streptosporangium sp. NBC_01469]|uniref:hypothetical protein n=1 Tax=Streptosporangium sp. NBC_01469 TaxID=2903898 RepID=UPI002E2DB86B|nr:hypothetical protein [Streptosporangium sp. NBC_01469]
MTGAGGNPAPSLPGRFGPSFDVRTVVVEPGGSRVHDEAEWRGAIVLLERGRIELVCSDGGRRAFGRGDVLWLEGLPVRALHNPGREPAVLLAISRRPARR